MRNTRAQCMYCTCERACHGPESVREYGHIEHVLVCGRVKAVPRALQSQGVNCTHALCEHEVGAGCMTLCLCVCVCGCPDLAREGKGASQHG
jgi:hypothetical protein